MKSRLLYISVVFVIIIACLLVYQVDIDSSNNRVHQHLEDEWQNNTDQNASQFQTQLPIVSIDTNGQVVPGDPTAEDYVKQEQENDVNFVSSSETITADFSLVDSQVGMNTLDDEKDVETYANIRYRGNSSRFFDKKSYAIHLVDEKGNEDKQSLAGMEAHNEWVLNGPFLDRSLLRNYLCYNVAGEIMDYAPDVRYCELFVNGEYQGVYLLIETISRGEGRLNLTKPENNRDMTSFIVRWDREGKGDNELENFTYYTYQSDVSALDVRYPGKNSITTGRLNYINEEISEIEKCLYSTDLQDPNNGYTEYLDLNEFAEYFVINEFFRNVDAGRFSTFYYKDVRGKVKPVVWDFNNGCDNYIDYVWDESGFSMQNAPWISRLLKDEKFVSAVVSKYKALRESVLSDEYLLTYIDETDTWLSDAVARNDELYGYVYDLNNYNGMNYLTPVERNVTSHKEAVDQLKDFITARGNWLDSYIETLYQYCSESKNANEFIR